MNFMEYLTKIMEVHNFLSRTGKLSIRHRDYIQAWYTVLVPRRNATRLYMGEERSAPAETVPASSPGMPVAGLSKRGPDFPPGNEGECAGGRAG